MTHGKETPHRSVPALSRRGSYAVPILSFLLLLLICIPNLAVPAYAASPDLMIESIWLEKDSATGTPVAQVAPGESFNIVATVKNIGDTTANGYYLDVYYDNDYGRGGPDIIMAGEVQTWFVGPFSAQEGTHTTKWVVDPDNQIAEANESNNLKELSFTIGSVVVTTTTTMTSESTSSTTSPQSAPPTLTLTPTLGPAGTVVSASGSSYQGTTCTLVAEPSSLFTSQTCTITAGSLAGSFTVDAAAPASTYTVTVQTDMGSVDSATATFTVTSTYSVTFYADPSIGQISADGASVTDGTTVTGYSGGQRVHVVASGPSGYQFASWEASGVSIDNPSSQDTYLTVSSSGSVKAHFTPIMYTITFYTDPASGTIAVDGATKTNGLTGAYAPGARVHVVANPPSGYSFASWETSGVSVDNPSSADTYMTVSGSGSLKARFGLPQVTVKSKSTLGAEFPGVRITVDKKYYSTPFSLTLQGKHTFTAPSGATVSGVSYKFVRWEDESGKTLSTTTSLSYTVQSSNTLYAVYTPPQYTVTVYANDQKSRKVIAGASVYLDGSLVGTTDSHGSLVLKGIYPGAHSLKIHKDGYVDYTTTINLSSSTTLRAYLNRAS
jgi:hypothetical protein